MRTTIALVLLAAAACGGDEPEIEATLRFADRTDAELERVVNAVTCSDMFMFKSQLNRFGDNIVDDRCPSITVSGDNVATITGGCVTRDGVQIQGSATVTNPAGWDHIEDYDDASDTVFTADQFVVIDENGTRAFDGVVRWIDSESTWDGDITVTAAGITLRSDLTYINRGNDFWPSWELAGNGIELVDVGGAHTSGTVAPDPTDRMISNFTVQGADELTVYGDSECVRWSITGTDRGTTCP